MRMVVILIGCGVLAVLAAAIWFRVVPMPAAVWHVEPADVTPPQSPNHDLRRGPGAPVFAAPLPDVAARLDRVARGEGAKIVAGDAAAGHVTYVVRSAIMGFPDAVSIRLRPEAGGTRAEIYSRSRYGYSDLGVNAARLDRWIAALQAPSGS